MVLESVCLGASVEAREVKEGRLGTSLAKLDDESARCFFVSGDFRGVEVVDIGLAFVSPGEGCSFELRGGVAGTVGAVKAGVGPRLLERTGVATGGPIRPTGVGCAAFAARCFAFSRTACTAEDTGTGVS